MIYYYNYTSKGHRTVWFYLYIWFRHILLILSVVNGGISINYTANSLNSEISYRVMAGVIFLVYVAVIGLWYMRKPGKDDGGSGEEEVRRVEAGELKSG